MDKGSPQDGSTVKNTPNSKKPPLQIKQLAELFIKNEAGLSKLKKVSTVNLCASLLAIFLSTTNILLELGWGPAISNSIKSIATVSNLGTGVMGATAFTALFALLKWFVRFLNR